MKSRIQSIYSIVIILLLSAFVSCDNRSNIEDKGKEDKDTVTYDYANMEATATIASQENSSEGLSAFLIMGVAEDNRHYQMTMWNYGSTDTILWVGDYRTTGGRRCLYNDGGSVCPYLTRYESYAILYLKDVVLLFDENEDGTYHAELTCTLPSGEKHHLYAPTVLRRSNSKEDLPYPQLQ